MDYKLIEGLSLRAGYILYQQGIDSIEKLKEWNRKNDLMELLKLRNCGLKTYHEILDFCIKHNI